MFKITGKVDKVFKDDSLVTYPLCIHIQDEGYDNIHAEGFDLNQVQHVLLLTEDEMARIDYLMSIKPEEGEVPKSAKELAVVHSYLQKHVMPLQVFGHNTDSIALELTKIWADMEEKECKCQS